MFAGHKILLDNLLQYASSNPWIWLLTVTILQQDFTVNTVRMTALGILYCNKKYWKNLIVSTTLLTPCISVSVYVSQRWQRAKPVCNTHQTVLNLLTPNDEYSGRTAPLTSKRCILYIYSTHIGIEYFKHGIYFPFFLFKMQLVS